MTPTQVEPIPATVYAGDSKHHAAYHGTGKEQER